MELSEIEPGFTKTTEAWTLTSCAVPHAQPWLTCLAFRIEADGKSIVYSGDAGYSDDLAALSEGADVLIHWCYRLSSETMNEHVAALSPHAGDIGALAERCGVKRLVLTHLRAHMDADPAHHAAMLAEAQAAFSGDVQIAEDPATISL